MNISKIIRQKRHELNMTQEQVAERLGVSASAVNKWERACCFPDITLLPSLARLLKTDLNTLMSFKEELTDMEINDFSKQICSIINAEGYDKGFNAVMNKLHEYPSCDALAYVCSCTLSVYINILNPTDMEHSKEYYKEKITAIYQNLSLSNIDYIKNGAVSMLVSEYISQKEYDKAEALLTSVPEKSFDKTNMQISLYISQKKYNDASLILENKLLNAGGDIFFCLMNMMEISEKEKRYDDSDYYADICSQISSLLTPFAPNMYIPKMQLALERKETDALLNVLPKLLKSISVPYSIGHSHLYKHLKPKESVIIFKWFQEYINRLETSPEFDFIKDNEDFKKVIEKYKN